MTMVVYEVNLAINADIYDDYYQWLLVHINEMLSHDGFKKAEIGEIVNPSEKNLKNVRVCYFIDTYEDLQNYLEEHAPERRLEAIKKFGHVFSATRRIILNPFVIQSS